MIFPNGNTEDTSKRPKFDEMALVQEAGGLEALMEKGADRCSERVEASNRKLLGEFLEQADKKAAERVQQSEVKLRAEFAAATSAIRGDVATLAKSVSELKSHAPPAQEGRNSNSNSNSSNKFRQLRQEMKDFRPTKVELKGWVTNWEKRYEEGLTKPEAVSCLDHLFAQLDEETKTLVDLVGTKRGLEGKRAAFFKIEVAVTGGKEACFAVKEKFDALLESPTNFVNGKKLQCKNEVSPPMKPVVSSVVKLLKFLEGRGVGDLGVEWGLNSHVVWQPSGGRPVLLGEFSEVPGWSLQAAGLEKASPGFIVTDTLAALRQ